MSERIKEEIRTFFQQWGMNPEKIEYNENLDYYNISIGVEGTDERFLEDIRELGSSEPVDQAVDTATLKLMASDIQGSDIPSGTINVRDTMNRLHFQIEVV